MIELHHICRCATNSKRSSCLNLPFRSRANRKAMREVRRLESTKSAELSFRQSALSKLYFGLSASFPGDDGDLYALYEDDLIAEVYRGLILGLAFHGRDGCLVVDWPEDDMESLKSLCESVKASKRPVTEIESPFVATTQFMMTKLTRKKSSSHIVSLDVLEADLKIIFDYDDIECFNPEVSEDESDIDEIFENIGEWNTYDVKLINETRIRQAQGYGHGALFVHREDESLAASGRSLLCQNGLVLFGRVAVHPDHQGKGCARKIIRMCMYGNFYLGHTRMIMLTYCPVRKHVALKCGFKCIGRYQGVGNAED